MSDCPGLRSILQKIDNRGYPAYRDIKGPHNFGDFQLIMDHIQGDPFASPSRIRVRIPDKISGFYESLSNSVERKTAFEDFIARVFEENLKKHSGGRKGSGKSGLIEIEPPGQEILRRSSVVKTSDSIEVRFFIGLPARGRRIDSSAASKMLFEIIPAAVFASLYYENLDEEALRGHIRHYEDSEYIRSKLDDAGLIAFVADGSYLPRTSGIDERPLSFEKAVSFRSPESLRVTFQTPNSGEISGMGIPKGVTLITGGGYHGKSTLLKAIERGIYAHIPGDGREFVITNQDAVKIRSEDGRRIESVDISPFIKNLPFGGSTEHFSTDNASGSTSQAANIIESVEAGAKALLIDEDTSATNFMIRDKRMQELISKENEPITPFIDKVRDLYEKCGISSIIIAGGCGDYIDVADIVVCMKEYSAFDVTERAKKIAAGNQAGRSFAEGGIFDPYISRIPDKKSINPAKGKRPVKISVKEAGKIEFGYERIDMTAIEQVSGRSQLRAIGYAINYSLKYMDGMRDLSEIAGLVEDDIRDFGIDIISPGIRGDLESFRKEELCAAMDRLRTLGII
ncbi:ABC transporter, ATPase, predicted [Methanolacinia petrolearia DSM 11571]|uniref:ABC transporter, ATPase, predicted n=1 Tax=Methanolacinia petrolearia (strain DSM 11571 / OCM 486 / SEBR 4847) TaxID=679926 RepID=E1RG20_METP4|nr:ABC-ATPase domain-containing protein [Methanolacinia petrolearia]ADN36255.1 ABC transporter, ATPase, predicted [Methanolacinia petrolearia DSM 11571]